MPTTLKPSEPVQDALNRMRRQVVALASALGLASLVVSLVVGALGLRLHMAEIDRNGQVQLSLQLEAFKRVFDRYRPLPALFSEHPTMIAFLRDPDQPGNRAELERRLERLTGLTAALDVVLVDQKQRLFSSRDVLTPKELSHPDLQNAPRQGRLGRAYLAKPSRLEALAQEPVYLFSHGIRDHGSYLGALVVALGLSQLEQIWALAPYPVRTVDLGGERTLGNSLSLSLEPSLASMRSYASELPQFDWQLQLFLSPTPAHWTGLTSGLLALAVCVLLSGAILWIFSRSQRATIQSLRARDLAQRLDRLVRQRTKELSQSNSQLEREVEERKQTEEELRTAQAGLVQTSKLAALGQMSAVLSHEFNQPLAAISSYVDNAIVLLERDDLDAGLDNLERMRDMVQRLAAISKHLRNFARKPRESLSTVPVAAVLGDALEIMSGRLKAEGVRLDFRPPDQVLWVQAGQIRLQQVIVNLVSNAIQATRAAKPEPLIRLSVAYDDSHVDIYVADNGTGLDPNVITKIFDPFFTTKGVGEGLGLGLSISYGIIDEFGGKLSAGNGAPDSSLPGALFRVQLVRIIDGAKSENPRSESTTATNQLNESDP